MHNRVDEFTTSLLTYSDHFLSPNPMEWTTDQKAWRNEWVNYIATGGERPPKAPPHA
jgi:hypothetical protein